MPSASLGQLFALASLRSVPQAGSQFRFAVICCNRCNRGGTQSFLHRQSKIYSILFQIRNSQFEITSLCSMPYAKQKGRSVRKRPRAPASVRMSLLARIFHDLPSRGRGEGCATGQPQGIGSEAYPNGTSQGPIPEDARKDADIRGRSRQFVKYPG